ncbi:hypothetical protein [Helicobacter sp. 23-1045]
MIFAFIFCACSSNQPQYVDSRDYISFGIDAHDIDDKITEITHSFLNSHFLKNIKEPKYQKDRLGVVVADIENHTDEDINTTLFRQKLVQKLINHKKFRILSSFEGRNKKIEKAIGDVRKLRDDSEYNQYTTIEKGNLDSPLYYLTGEISQTSKVIDDKKIVNYFFSFELINLQNGELVWSDTKTFSKESKNDESTSDESTSGSMDFYSANFPNEPQYNYTQSYDDDSDSWEDVKEFFSFGADGRNHFILGFDGGILNMGGKINIAPIDFTIIDKWNGTYPTTTITPHTLYANDSLYSYPLTARVGYLRDFGDNWAFGLNFIYSYMIASVGKYNIKTTASSTDIDMIEPTFKLQRIGGEVEIYYKFKDIPQHWGGGDIYMYLGGGAMKDLGSKVKITLEATRWSSYTDISINTTGQKRLSLEQKIDSWYPIVKLGLIWYFNDYIGLSYELNCSWALGESSSVSSGFGWGVLGLRVKI